MSTNEQSHSEQSYRQSWSKNVCKLISAGAAVCVPASRFQSAELMSAAVENDYKLTSELVYNENLKAKFRRKPRAAEMRSHVASKTFLQYSGIRRKGSKHISKRAGSGQKTNATQMQFGKPNRRIRRRRPASNREARQRRSASNRKARGRRLASNRAARGKRPRPPNAKARSSAPKQFKRTLNCYYNHALLLAPPGRKPSKRNGDGGADNVTNLPQADTIAVETETAAPSSTMLAASKTEDSAAMMTASMAETSQETWDNGTPLSENILSKGQLTTMAQDEAIRGIPPRQNLSATQYDELTEASSILQNHARRELRGGSPLDLAPTQLDSSFATAPNSSGELIAGEQNGWLSKSQTADVKLQEAERNLRIGMMTHGSDEECNTWRRHRFPCFEAKIRPCPVPGISWGSHGNFFIPTPMICPDPENLVGEVWAGFPEERARPQLTGESLSKEFPTIWDKDPPLFKKDPFLTGALYNARTDKKRTSPEEDSEVYYNFGVANAKNGTPIYDDCKTSVRGINRIGLEAKVILWTSGPGIDAETPQILLQIKRQHGRTVDQLEQLAENDTLTAAVELVNSKDIKDVTGEPRTSTVAKKYAEDFIKKLVSSGVYIRTVTPDMVTFDPKSKHPFSVIAKKDVTCAGVVDDSVASAAAAKKSGDEMQPHLSRIIEIFLDAAMARAEKNEKGTTAGNSTVVAVAPKYLERFRDPWRVPLRADTPCLRRW